MRIGYLKIMQPMQGQAKGYVVLAWHRNPWWSWGVWWRPSTPESRAHWGTYGWKRARGLQFGPLGELWFQHQM